MEKNNLQQKIEKFLSNAKGTLKMTPTVVALVIAGMLSLGCEFEPFNTNKNVENTDTKKMPETDIELAQLVNSYITTCLDGHTKESSKSGRDYDIEIAQRHAECIMECISKDPLFQDKTIYFSADFAHDHDGKIVDRKDPKSYVRDPKEGTETGGIKYLGLSVNPVDDKKLRTMSQIRGGPLGTQYKKADGMTIEDEHGDEIDRWF